MNLSPLSLPLVALLACSTVWAAAPPEPAPVFRAGAAAVDITPLKFPVRVNGNFTERLAQQANDRLHARALALDDGKVTAVLCVVDTCMMSRELIDKAKAQASKETGIPVSRMLVSATHTHSAPSALGCLGSREDPEYAAWLPGKISEALTAAAKALQPARIGWSSVDDWDHTHNRRWIYRPDKVPADPFGQPTVRAMMHPGHESPQHVGPSGPVDPELSVVSVQTLDGKPLAVLANYSQHYFGATAVSADYYGVFCREVAKRLGQASGEGPFVAMMTQGTSGDLMWRDYAKPAKNVSMTQYAEEVAGRAAEALAKVKHHNHVPLNVVETHLPLHYRTPDGDRLAWARQVVAPLVDRLPQSKPEIYAKEALYLHEKQKTELVLQAWRIGDLTLAALPNEVFALTGLKLKSQAPLGAHFNISLANGAEGYIPPPEQHFLGGYTTWPARTAGLEVQAEPRIVESLLGALEVAGGSKRRLMKHPAGAYTQAVLAAGPLAYWRLEEAQIPDAREEQGKAELDATMENGVALYLPGPEGAGFSGGEINRSVHLAGGRLRALLPTLPKSYSIEMWFWNGLPDDARPVTGYLFSRGKDGDAQCAGDHVGIGGTVDKESTGRLIVYNGNQRKQLLLGRTRLALRAWHHVVMARDGDRVRVYLNGNLKPEIEGELPSTLPDGPSELFLGGRCDRFATLEGKVDEAAVYARALAGEEIASRFKLSGQTPPPAVAANEPAPTPTPPNADKAAEATPPLSPEESLKRVHVPEGVMVALAAAEPLVLDPVAFDWDARGRLWVVEMADYPLGMDGKGQPGGRVRILEDTDGDLRYDKATLFAEGLRFPTGILTWRDGCLITAAPEVLFLRDENGDGKVDDGGRTVLLSGFQEGNQQLRVNGLRWGLDGWVYCANGGHTPAYGKEVQITSSLTGKRIALGSRDFRFKPDSGEIEPLSGPAQFGRNRDEWGRWFGVQNSNPIWHYALEDRHLQRNPHVAPPSPKVLLTEPNARVYPVSAPEQRFHSFDQAGRFTSACSATIVGDARLMGSSAPGVEQAMVCEPFHNLVQHLELTPEGPSFKARQVMAGKHDFFASEDRWCRPVMVRTGPDGALWVADMYRYMIEHPQWLPDSGKNALLPHYRKGDDKGRIYRVFAKDRAPSTDKVALDKASPNGLVATLESGNAWRRDKAHMLLAWSTDRSVLPALGQLASESKSPLARVHALWILHAKGALESGLLAKALQDTAVEVRENALQMAAGRREQEVIGAACALANDPDAKVRLQLATTLWGWEDPVASKALIQLAQDSGNIEMIRAAALSSAQPHLTALAKASEQRKMPEAMTDGLLQTAAGAGNAEALSLLMGLLLDRAMADADVETTVKHTAAVGSVWQALKRKGIRLEVLAATKSDSPDWQSLIATEKALTEKLRRMADAASTPLTVRIAAAAALLAYDEQPTGPVAVLLEAMQPGTGIADFKTAAAALRNSGSDEIAVSLLESWAQYSPAQREVVLDLVLEKPEATRRLLDALQTRLVLPASLDIQRQSRLLKYPDKLLRERASTLLGAPSSRQKVLDTFRPALTLPGDATRGRQVFAQACVACHQLDGTGLVVGPDLRTVVQHPADKLFTSILDPSANIEPGFTAYFCELNDGTQLYGAITSEAGDSLTLRLADGSARTVLRSGLKHLQSANVSLMPDGLEALLTPQSLADLIAYLKVPK
jgi:putative membrane-bound dehydrogenase-like protein